MFRLRFWLVRDRLFRVDAHAGSDPSAPDASASGINSFPRYRMAPTSTPDQLETPGRDQHRAPDVGLDVCRRVCRFDAVKPAVCVDVDDQRQS